MNQVCEAKATLAVPGWQGLIQPSAKIEPVCAARICPILAQALREFELSLCRIEQQLQELLIPRSRTIQIAIVTIGTYLTIRRVSEGVAAHSQARYGMISPNF